MINILPKMCIIVEVPYWKKKALFYCDDTTSLFLRKWPGEPNDALEWKSNVLQSNAAVSYNWRKEKHSSPLLETWVNAHITGIYRHC
jgi:hypothetical protein